MSSPALYRTFNAEEYAALPDDQHPWIIHDILPAGGSAILSGLPKAKKSFGALQMAYAIADPSQTDWLTFPVETHGPVLYCQADTARIIWKERFQRYRDVNKLMTTDLHVADKQSMPSPFEILNFDHFSWLRDTCKAIQPIAVIIDVLRKITSVSEDKSDEIIRVLNALGAATSPAGLVIISHARKPQQSQGFSNEDLPVGTDNRGSTAIIGDVDAIVRFSKKRVSFSGRTMEEGHLKIAWSPETYLFSVDSSEFDVFLSQVIADASLKSERAKAIVLSELSKRSPSACRSAIRRRMGRLK